MDILATWTLFRSDFHTFKNIQRVREKLSNVTQPCGVGFYNWCVQLFARIDNAKYKFWHSGHETIHIYLYCQHCATSLMVVLEILKRKFQSGGR